jgi:hypothetical protein
MSDHTPVPPFTVRVFDLHWLEGIDSEQDLCAHGSVEIVVDGHAATAHDLAVGAACVLLLRTLTADHEPDGDSHLFPHGGHAFLTDEQGWRRNINCDQGLPVSVRYYEDTVNVALSEDSAQLPLRQWVDAVCRFCDEVERFYDESAPKRPPPEDRQGYPAFWEEWRARRANAPL